MNEHTGYASTNAALPLAPPAEPAPPGLTDSDRAFVLALVSDAVRLGITDVEYKGLRVRVSPNAAREGQRFALANYSAQGGAGAWSTPVPRAGQRGGDK